MLLDASISTSHPYPHFLGRERGLFFFNECVFSCHLTFFFFSLFFINSQPSFDAYYPFDCLIKAGQYLIIRAEYIFTVKVNTYYQI